MIEKQMGCKAGCYQTKECDNQGCWGVRESLQYGGYPQGMIHMGGTICNTRPMCQHDEKKKNKELFVVPSSDAGAQPFAMMIKTMDTVPAEMAMEGSFRSENQACITVFKSCNYATTIA